MQDELSYATVVTEKEEKALVKIQIIYQEN